MTTIEYSNIRRNFTNTHILIIMAFYTHKKAGVRVCAKKIDSSYKVPANSLGIVDSKDNYMKSNFFIISFGYCDFK